MTDRSITPPPELLKQWEDDWFDERKNVDILLIQAYQAGADAELEACVGWLNDVGYAGIGTELRAARRPKPPSLKEQALVALHAVAAGANDMREQCHDLETIRRAIESIPDPS